MEAKYTDPFSMAAVNVFKTALNCEIRPERVQIKEDGLPAHEVSGVILLDGKVCGAAALSVSAPAGFKIVEAMLGAEIDEINADVTDAICELINMVAGGAKTFLSDCQLSLGLPEIVVARSRALRFPADCRPACIQFVSPWGPVAVEVGLAPAKAEC